METTIGLTLLWVFLGLWISHKRGWYYYEELKDARGGAYVHTIATIILMPFFLIANFLIVFVFMDWKNIDGE